MTSLPLCQLTSGDGSALAHAQLQLHKRFNPIPSLSIYPIDTYSIVKACHIVVNLNPLLKIYIVHCNKNRVNPNSTWVGGDSACTSSKLNFSYLEWIFVQA